MADQQYTNVADMVRDISDDKELLLEVESSLSQRQIIGQLLAQRAARGMSQFDVSERLNRSQSWVSKLESGCDADARYGDLCEYASAVGLSLHTCAIPTDRTAVEKVKDHVFTIHQHMEEMADLAKADEGIAVGVAKFFYEVLFNITHLLGRTAMTLPKRPDGSPYCKIEITPYDEKKSEEEPLDDSLALSKR